MRLWPLKSVLASLTGNRVIAQLCLIDILETWVNLYGHTATVYYGRPDSVLFLVEICKVCNIHHPKWQRNHPELAIFFLIYSCLIESQASRKSVFYISPAGWPQAHCLPTVICPPYVRKNALSHCKFITSPPDNINQESDYIAV